MKGKVQNDYARKRWYWQHHHRRFAALANKRKLICQECGGSGGEIVPILDDGSGPFEECPICEGTGYIPGWWRGWWLRWKREEKRKKQKLKKGKETL